MMTHLHAGLSSETMEKARSELNENPDTLHQDIQQVNTTTHFTAAPCQHRHTETESGFIHEYVDTHTRN